MAFKVEKIQHFTSDLTGQELNGDAVRITIRYQDSSRGLVTLDAAEAEVEHLIAVGRHQNAPGRKKQQVPA